eukprot:CAMPEP_0178918686 /NCGR_PEP_ID=MMETSP0786-20121207/13962_1 /TAXON_ID=186022 /ORGANISM="Thalassionema frauenfeldii, Strain CCMP 1798" /LENGTH=778 /DNA_ID=CAMNT_0020592419 /DNA_START=81 /DNA_END=2414 /DNA_ORIENTATION=+
MLRRKINVESTVNRGRRMATLIIRGTATTTSTIAPSGGSFQQDSAPSLRCKSTTPPRLLQQEEAHSLKQLMETLNVALTAPQIIHNNILQKTVGVENYRSPTPKEVKTVIAPIPCNKIIHQPCLLPEEAMEAFPVPQTPDTNNDIQKGNEKLPRLIEKGESVGSDIVQGEQTNYEKTFLSEEPTQNLKRKLLQTKDQDDATSYYELIDSCIHHGDVEKLMRRIRSFKRHFDAGTINAAHLRKVFRFLLENNPLYAQEVLLMIKNGGKGFDEKLHFEGLRQLCVAYGGKLFSTSPLARNYRVRGKVKELIDEILSLSSEERVQSIIGNALLPRLMRSSLEPLNEYARPLYHHYMDRRGGLSAIQLEKLLRTFRYNPTRGPLPQHDKSTLYHKRHSKDHLRLSFYATILQDYVKAVLELNPDDNTVNPRHALDLISRTYPFLDNINVIYEMLQTLRPLFSNDLNLDRGTLEHLIAAAAKKNHQDLGLLIWDLYDVWDYKPSEGCFESMIILLLKDDLHRHADFYETDHDINVLKCLTHMIDSGYTPQLHLLKSMGRKLRLSEPRSKAWVRCIKSNREYQTTEAFNAMLATQAAQGHLGITVKLMEDLNNFRGIKPNKESYGFAMEALATKVQMIINKIEKKERMNVTDSKEQQKEGPSNLSSDDSDISIMVTQEINKKKGYWFRVADDMLDEMEKKNEIPIDHFTFHQYIRFLTLVGELELALDSTKDANDGLVVEVREKTWILLLNAHLFAGKYSTAEREILPFLKEDPKLYRDRIETW